MKIKTFALIGLLSIFLVSGLSCGPTTYQLTTIVEGQGIVSPSEGSFSKDGVIALSASPASGWSFSYWGGQASGSQNPINIIMDSDKTVYAYFTANPIPTPTQTTNPTPTPIQTTNPTPTPTATALPSISLSQSMFVFSATQGASNPSGQTLTIHNSGGGTLYWTINDNATWLQISQTSGSTAGGSSSVVVSVSISGLSANTYTATITVSATGASNSPQTIPVTLTINPVPMETVHTTWNLVWKTITGDGIWGAQVGTSQFPSTFSYDWVQGTVFGGYKDYIGFNATATINMSRPGGGTVQFTIGSDDGSYLYLDGTRIIDNWGDHSWATKSAAVFLTYGKHTLLFRYYEWTVNARVSFTCDADVLEWEEPAY